MESQRARMDNFSIENLKMEKDAAIRLKDDLVAQLRVMKKRLQEAEEEQYKAEEDAAALRAELEVLHRREEHQNIIATSATSEQYYLLQQEVETVKVELQNALRQLRQEQQKVVKEQEHAANLKAEQEQLKIALTEAQRAREGRESSVGKFSTDVTLKEKDLQLHELASMVERLESGRQKLLTEIDVQSMEIERLFVENDSLAASLKEASMFTGQWEHQVQDCLQENANLRAELSDLRARLTVKVDKSLGESSDADKENESSKVQVELSRAKGQAEALSAQVLQLSADLNRAMQHISSLNWLYRPVLANIENRLLQVKQHGNYNELKLTA